MAKLEHCISIEDLRVLGKKKIPRVVCDYIDGGSEDEITLQRNKSIFNSIQFVPRVLQDVKNINLGKKINGVESSMPIVCAPTGLTRMFHYQGEPAVIKAAHEAGIPYTLSTVSTTSIEDVAACSDGNRFFQVYIWHNREWVFKFIDR